MSPCSCPPQRWSSIAFSRQVTLVRCRGCDAQAWFVAGEVVPQAEAHAVLREVFAAASGTDATRARAVRAGRALSAVADVPPAPAIDRPVTLADVLAARGVQGAWQVAG